MWCVCSQWKFHITKISKHCGYLVRRSGAYILRISIVSTVYILLRVILCPLFPWTRKCLFLAIEAKRYVPGALYSDGEYVYVLPSIPSMHICNLQYGYECYCAVDTYYMCSSCKRVLPIVEISAFGLFFILTHNVALSLLHYVCSPHLEPYSRWYQHSFKVPP